MTTDVYNRSSIQRNQYWRIEQHDIYYRCFAVGDYPDLAVSAVSGPTTALPGQTVPISWTVANVGAAAANGTWTAVVYLADNASGSNPQAIASSTFNGPLAANASVYAR